MNLLDHAKRVNESFGMVHQLNLRALRSYLKEQPEVNIVKEIEGINNPSLLRSLWEAGLIAPFQNAVLKKLE